MTKTETMRRRVRGTLTSAPPIQPPPPPETAAAAVPEPDPRIGRLLARVESELSPGLAELRRMLERTVVQTDYVPPAVAACTRAQENAAKATDALRSSILRLEDQVRRIEEAALDICDHGEGRLRRTTAALFLACTLPGTVGTLWLAWRANLL